MMNVFDANRFAIRRDSPPVAVHVCMKSYFKIVEKSQTRKEEYSQPSSYTSPNTTQPSSKFLIQSYPLPTSRVLFLVWSRL